MQKYLPQEIEKKWQEKWRTDKLYKFHWDSTSDKYYTLVELPYTSGDLHVGHWFNWVTPDVYSRFQRMAGKNVFFPHGYDAIGLPAENAAIKRGIHPRDWTMKNIETMQAQFATMGSMIDLENITITCDPSYFKWNQWIFIKMFEKGIAYRGTTLSNWCPVDKTVLADEHVEAGKCWRCGAEVEKKEVAQWFLKITKYADELIWPDNPKVDWPTSVQIGQNQWIGRKEGIEITYDIEDSKEKVSVFTTRPDTNFGATFIALSPEHPLVSKITTKEQKKEVEVYVKSSSKKSELERLENREKTGAFTGSYAINQLTGYKMPIWVSDFVLTSFGTGALVGVPGHDRRDFEFASKFGLEIKRVVVGKDGDKTPVSKLEQVQEEEGTMVNSDFLNGMNIHKATEKIMDHLEEKGWGKRVVQYHIRDWSISRQRYWGTPVPMIHCEKCGVVPIPLEDLPVDLPYEVDFTPKGKPPLASNEKWLKVKCPKCGGEAQRDPETLDTFFDSAWYYYRYLDPKYDQGPFDQNQAKIMMPVDIYFGGAEHTLGHTLYARFFTKFFKDLGLVSFDEFALKRVQHGIVLGPDGNKMSKSKGNVINPDDVVKEYGADTVRIYLAFMMAYEDTAAWSPTAIAGVYRFLKRVWGLQEKVKGDSLTKEDEVVMNRTIKKLTDDLTSIKGNTAVAKLMEWLNHLSRRETISKKEYQNFLIILAPFAPHITEELWQMIGEKYSIHNQSWPKIDEKKLVGDSVKIPVQVNGKLRGVLEMSSDKIDEKNVVEEALKKEQIQKHVGSQKTKNIYIKGKLLNLVVS